MRIVVEMITWTSYFHVDIMPPDLGNKMNSFAGLVLEVAFVSPDWTSNLEFEWREEYVKRQ